MMPTFPRSPLSFRTAGVMTAADSYSAPAAREVLARCEYLLAELRDKPTGIAWQTKLSAVIALLRSVGHVLHKVDANKSEPLKKAVEQWWKAINSTKPRPEIFWQFIDEERNLILKQGKFQAGQSVTVSV